MVEMQRHPAEASPPPKTQPTQALLEVSSPSDTQPHESSPSRQLVVYDPHANGAAEEIQPITCHPSPFSNMGSRVLPSVGAFTVQCASCFKWRLIPSKEKYEEIREHILQNPFYCETAREWRPDISCSDPPDISQDGTRLWAIDRPNIAQPPRGWQRLLRIRGEGSTKFADVYYVAPSGKRLRSMVEVQKYLMEHPDYVTNGVRMSQFSFQIPKPLQENYVRKKRPARLRASDDHANPVAWAGPDDRLTLHLPHPSSSEDDPAGQPTKRQARTFVESDALVNPIDNHVKTMVQEPGGSRNTGDNFLA